jgi:hypothetical protein
MERFSSIYHSSKHQDRVTVMKIIPPPSSLNWFHTPKEKREMIHSCFSISPKKFKKGEVGSFHLVCGPVNKDLFVKIVSWNTRYQTEMREKTYSAFQHFISNWLAKALEHPNNSALRALGIRPAKTFHIVKTLTTVEFEKLYSILEQLNTKIDTCTNEAEQINLINRKAKLEKHIQWMEQIKIMAFGDNKDCPTLRQEAQSVFFMENTPLNVYPDEKNDGISQNLTAFIQAIREKYGLIRLELMTDLNFHVQNEFPLQATTIDPTYGIPITEGDYTLRKHRRSFLDLQASGQKLKEVSLKKLQQLKSDAREKA